VRDEARVVVIGGGVAGCSLLYHLARLGWSDVVLVEKDELTSGSTWHAAGLCTQFNSSYNMMNLLRYSIELYESLEAETGQAVDYHRCGSLRLATSRDRLDEFHHRKGIADTLGIPFEIITPERARELFPLAHFDDVLAAAYLPTDGFIDPTGLTHALAKGAQAKGAEIVRHTAVTGVEREAGGWLVRTSKGDIRAEVVVNAAGQWAREIGRMVGIELPIVPIEHHYLITEPVPEVAALGTELPVLRDADASFYIRGEGGALLVGPFERGTKPWALDGIPQDFHSSLLPPDLERLEPVLEAVAQRIPTFADAGIKTVVNGPDGYTPDGHCLMGPVPGLVDFHVLAGFSIFGIVFGGGAGRYAAEWIVEGQTSDNMWEVDVRRFDDYAASTKYVVARACEVYEREYAIHYPEEELPAARPLKTGPLYDRLLAKGAVYGARFGWERPLWFARSGPAQDEYSFRRARWHAAVGEECRAIQAGVGVLDQTSFAKYEVSGPGAESFLDRLCANRLPKAVGRIALTQMCTPRGGVECDVTVTRLAEDRFYVVSAAATERHDFAWIASHLPDDGQVMLENTTSRDAVLTLAGPKSRELLQALTDEDISRKAFRFFRCREFHVGMVPVRALRVSFVGELGFELHHPVAYQRHLYDLLMGEGEAHGIVDWGYRTLDSMRLEKAYRLWGVDLSADWTPLEAGFERFVNFDKGDFIGREALLRQRDRGVERKLACLVVDAADADAHGYEPVRSEGKVVGYVASGGYGHRVEQSIAFSYLPAALVEAGTPLEVDVLGERRPAQVVLEPLYDPENERLLS
jgi:dimethylglycine dehydrogenase